jgi:hypothetical protein
LADIGGKRLLDQAVKAGHADQLQHAHHVFRPRSDVSLRKTAWIE